jgi:uncharacterized LabA/DUF88 family protein
MGGSWSRRTPTFRSIRAILTERIARLKTSGKGGWLVHTKVGAIAGDTYKCDFDVEITLDLMRTAEIVKPDIIVLLSGDKDFVPVMLELRQRGIRVEVAAFPGKNAAREVMLKASGFIDLDAYLNEPPDNRPGDLETDESDPDWPGSDDPATGPETGYQDQRQPLANRSEQPRNV